MSFLSRLFRNRPAAPGAERSRILAHVAFDGAIRVLETPVGAGWHASEDSREGDDFVVMVLKYLLDAQPAPLVLLAKIYTLSAESSPPDDPRNTDWKAVLGSLFESVDDVVTHSVQQLTMRGAAPAVEATLNGISNDGAFALRIRERRAVVGHEQLIVTAVGPTDLFERHAPEIESWFSTVAFVPVAEQG